MNTLVLHHEEKKTLQESIWSFKSTNGTQNKILSLSV